MRCHYAGNSIGDMPVLGVCPSGEATTRVTVVMKGGRREAPLDLCRTCTHATWKRYAWSRGHTVIQEPLPVAPKMGFWGYVFGKAGKRILP